LSLSYDSNLNKKNILLNKKKVTKKVLNENSLKICYFLPITMNLFYLGPKYRRDFLDEILSNSFPVYDDFLKKYDKVLKCRNKILKNISE
jgi:recombinational DNA repair ATPase RecF